MSASAVFERVLPATPDTEETLYTVTVGKIFVLSDLHFTNLVSTPSTVNVRIKADAGDSDSNAEYYVFEYPILATDYDNLLPRGTKTVLPAGSVIKVCSASGQVAFSVSGMEE